MRNTVRHKGFVAGIRPVKSSRLRRALSAILVTLVASVAVAALPEGYVTLEYVESTGSQYLDTGYVPNANTAVEAVYELRASGQSRNYIAGSFKSDNCRFQISPMGSSRFYGWGTRCAYDDKSRCPSSVEKLGVRTVRLDRGIVTIDGILEATLTDSTWPWWAGNSLYVFSNNTGSAPTVFGKIRLYSLKIYESDVLVHDYAPCMQVSTGKAGLYDKKDLQFLGNLGSGDDLTKGPLVDVPRGYEVRAYVESNGKQYIDTLYKPNGKTVAEFTYSLLKTSQNRNYVLGYCNNDGHCRFQYSPPGSGSLFGYGPSTYAPSAIVKDAPGSHSVTMGPDGLVYDGNLVQTFGNAWQKTSAGTLIAFGSHAETAAVGSMSSIRLYGLTLSEEGVVQRKYVPCVRLADGIAGLYDLTQTDGSGFCANQNAADGAEPFAAAATRPVTCRVGGWPYECGEVSPAYGSWSGEASETAPAVFTAPQKVVVRNPELALKCTGYDILSNGVVWASGTGTRCELPPVAAERVEVVWKWANAGTVRPRYQSVIRLPKVVSDDSLEDLPVLVRISPERISGFSYAQLSGGGADVLFRGMDGRVLPHDVDEWNESGESCVWVRVPSVGANGARICMSWGGLSALSPAGNAWSDHVGVWHLADCPETGAVDATGHGHSAVGTGAQSATEGFCGRGVALDEVLQVADFESEFPTADGMSLSGWFAVNPYQAGKALLSKGGLPGGWRVQTADDTVAATTYRGFGVSVGEDAVRPVVSRYTAYDTWRHLTLVKQGNSWTVYDNGLKGLEIEASALTAGSPLLLGADGVRADEVRLRNQPIGADRAALEYLAMQANYLSYGPAEKMPAPPGLVLIFR